MASQSKVSAGVMLVRVSNSGEREVLLAHYGGPFFKHKDLGSWAVPKGEVGPGEELLTAAKRELAEELGAPAPEGPFHSLGFVEQKSGKTVHAWAVRSDFDPQQLRSNTFELEWPRGSGKLQQFPEIDRVEWFSLEVAAVKINPAQRPFLDRVAALELTGAPEVTR